MMAGKNQSEYVRKVNFTKKFKLYYLEDIEIMLGESLHEEQRNSVRRVSTIGEYYCDWHYIPCFKGEKLLRGKIWPECAEAGVAIV
jgi:hypothetical protein